MPHTASTVAQVTSDFSVTSSATLQNVPDLVINVVANRTYSFEAHLACTCAATGGVRAGMGGTCTGANVLVDGYVRDSNALKGMGTAAVLGGSVANTTTTATSGVMAEMKGTITIGTGGTLAVQFAQSASTATPSVVKRGSYFVLWEQP